MHSEQILLTWKPDNTHSSMTFAPLNLSLQTHFIYTRTQHILTRPCVLLGQDYRRPQSSHTHTRLSRPLGCVMLCHTSMGLATVSPAVLPPIHQPHPPSLSTLSPLRQPVSPWPCVIKLHLSIILARDAIAYHIKEVREVWFQQPRAYADLFPPNGIHTPSSTCHYRTQRWGPHPSTPSNYTTTHPSQSPRKTPWIPISPLSDKWGLIRSAGFLHVAL